MAVTSVHAPVWRRHAGGFGQRQVCSLTGESDAMTPDRPRTWPDGRAAETAKAPKPPRFRSVKERGLGRANAQGGENRQASAGRWTQLAGAKPDAGASAGDEALARPVARPGSERLDIGRQVWPGAKGCRRFAGRIVSEGHPHAGESGVGSNAGPICIAPCPRERRFRESRPLILRNCLLWAVWPFNASSHFRGNSFLSRPLAATKYQPGLPFAQVAIYRPRHADGKSHTWP